MATNLSLSHSIRKGQTAILCQLCENEPKLKWKCLECGLMMCQRCCDKVHPKFPSAKDHTIIDIRDISKHQTESKPKLDFATLVCRNHTTQKCCMFCKSCDEIVCPECIENTHTRHDLIEISKGYDLKVANFRNGQENIDSAIHSITNGAAELCKIKYLEQARCKRTRQEILSYEQVLSDAVKEHINKLLNEVDLKREDVVKSIDEEEKKAYETCQTLTKQKEYVNDLLESHTGEKIFSTHDTFEQFDKLNNKLVNTTFDHVHEFVPGDKTIIPDLAGSLKSVSSLYNPVPQVIQRYTTEVQRCDNLIACIDGSFWINDVDMKQLQKVNPTKEVMKVISNFDIENNDMSLMPNGDLLLCSLNQGIKVIPVGTEEIKDSPYNLHFVSPFIPVCIHATYDNKVMVGVAQEGPSYLVIVMDHSGKQEQVYQYDNNSQPLFNFPVHIHSNKSNVIGVVDQKSEDTIGRIVVLDQGGMLKNIYTGHPQINSDDNPFKPFDISTSASDNFLILEPNNRSLHILNSHGNMLTFYNLKEMRMKNFISISISGHLFIGNFVSSKKSREKAKIYKIDNFVW